MQPAVSLDSLALCPQPQGHWYVLNCYVVQVHCILMPGPDRNCTHEECAHHSPCPNMNWCHGARTERLLSPLPDFFTSFPRT